MNNLKHPLSFSDIDIPSRKISTFSNINKNKYRSYFGKKFLSLFLAFKDYFNKHGYNFDVRLSFNKDNLK